jgi:pilus assembly protein CpaC
MPLASTCRFWTLGLLWAAVFIFLGLSGGVAVAQEKAVVFKAAGDVVSIRMSPSKTLTIRTNRDFADLVVGNAEIADVAPLTGRSLYVLAKAYGHTNIAVYDDAHSLIGMIDVMITIDVDEVRQALRSALPRQEIGVSTVNNRLRLSGNVPDAVTLRTALDIAQQFTADPVINTLRVTDPQQVLLEVRFLEVKRTNGRDLGVGWQGVNTSNPSYKGGQDIPYQAGVGQNYPGFQIGSSATGGLPLGGTPFGSIIAKVLNAGISVDVVIKALEAQGVARKLAEPNLSTLSGETASFLAGGKFPVPVQGDAGKISVDYKEYGVRLSFTPVVLDGGLIHLTMKPEVSEIDPSLSVTINGTLVPSLTTRETVTTVELHDGQSLSVAGLLQASSVKASEKLPWIGSVPVLGALFRSASFRKAETDLVVIVTPHIIRPARPGEPLRSPLDGKRPSNDPEFFVLGKDEVSTRQKEGFAKGAGVKGPYGHIIDLKEPASAVRK